MSGETDDLTPFTQSLANVPPHPGQLDRDALLFAAGRASVRRGAWWAATTAALAALSTVLAVVLVARPPTVVEVERIVHVPTPAPHDAPPPDSAGPRDEPTSTVPSPALVWGSGLRQRVLGDGVGELPQAPWASQSSPPSADDVPDLSSLRLHASHSEGERFR
jgi:hypothetical protein